MEARLDYFKIVSNSELSDVLAYWSDHAEPGGFRSYTWNRTGSVEDSVCEAVNALEQGKLNRVDFCFDFLQTGAGNPLNTLSPSMLHLRRDRRGNFVWGVKGQMPRMQICVYDKSEYYDCQPLSVWRFEVRFGSDWMRELGLVWRWYWGDNYDVCEDVHPVDFKHLQFVLNECKKHAVTILNGEGFNADRLVAPPLRVPGEMMIRRAADLIPKCTPVLQSVRKDLFRILTTLENERLIYHARNEEAS